MNMTHNNHPADTIYRQFEDSALRYDGVQPTGRGKQGLPLFTDMFTGSTIAVKIPQDADGMPTISDIEIGELVGLRVFLHHKDFGIAESMEVTA